MTHPRSLVACSLALALGVALSANGCANGGGTSGSSGDGGGGPPDVTTPDAPTDASTCAAPKTLCGSSCTSTSTDPKNCGKCGAACGANQVCNDGVCSYSCTPPETLCNAPPEGGTEDASGTSGEGGGTTEAGGSSGGGGDASQGADAEPEEDAGGDGGSSLPYCANLGNDNNNCGACGTVCTGEHTCQSGQCGLSCGPGQVACIAGDTCVATGTCCSSADCSVTGQICPQPGGACACPGGETVCASINSCIGSSYCCTDADCASLAGATCPTPGQACQCANGQKACISTQSCIPQTSCCTAAGECCDDPLGKSCSAATVQATLALGGSDNVQGYITAAGEEDWLEVVFNNNTNTAFHGHIVFSANPNNEYVFDVSSDCKGTLLSCGEGGLCQGKTEWEEYYTNGAPTGETWAPISIGTVYIKVYRADGAPTCDQWALTISE